jgi:hypothetical protein
VRRLVREGGGMKVVRTPSCPVSIFIAGDHAKAIEAMERHVQEHPYCVTVTPTTYVHTSGTDPGVIIGLINYPRFPRHPDEIWAKAEQIAAYLREELGQESYTIQGPAFSEWTSHRAEDTPTPRVGRIKERVG